MHQAKTFASLDFVATGTEPATQSTVNYFFSVASRSIAH